MDAKRQFLFGLFLSMIISSRCLPIQIIQESDEEVQTEDLFLPYLGQQSTDLSLFKFQPVFEGNWVREGSDRQFDEFKNERGWSRCQFAYRTPDITSPKMFFLEIVDGVILCTTRFTWISSSTT